MPIGPVGINVSRILIKIQNFSFTKMHLKVSSAKWQPFCAVRYELNWRTAFIPSKHISCILYIPKIYTRFRILLLWSYLWFSNVFVWLIYPYPSGLRHWRHDRRMDVNGGSSSNVSGVFRQKQASRTGACKYTAQILGCNYLSQPLISDFVTALLLSLYQYWLINIDLYQNKSKWHEAHT